MDTACQRPTRLRQAPGVTRPSSILAAVKSECASRKSDDRAPGDRTEPFGSVDRRGLGSSLEPASARRWRPAPAPCPRRGRRDRPQPSRRRAAGDRSGWAPRIVNPGGVPLALASSARDFPARPLSNRPRVGSHRRSGSVQLFSRTEVKGFREHQQRSWFAFDLRQERRCMSPIRATPRGRAADHRECPSGSWAPRNLLRQARSPSLSSVPARS